MTAGGASNDRAEGKNGARARQATRMIHGGGDPKEAEPMTQEGGAYDVD